jgi:hypothetical protein
MDVLLIMDAREDVGKEFGRPSVGGVDLPQQMPSYFSKFLSFLFHPSQSLVYLFFLVRDRVQYWRFHES